MKRWISGLALASVAVAAASASAATVPYTNDFSTQADDFTTAGTTAWALSGGTLNHTHTVSGSWTALAPFPQLGGTTATASDFGLSGEVTVTAGNGTGTYVSLAAVNTAATVGYQFRVIGAVGTGNNGITIYRGANLANPSDGTNSTPAGAAGTGVQLRNLLGIPLRLNVTGTYIDTNADSVKDALSLIFNVARTDTGASLGTVNYTDTSPLVLPQARIGFWDNNSQNNPFTVAWNDITVVPEPATLSLAFVGGMALLRRRR